MRDPVTGVEVARLTEAPVIQHHLYFTGPTVTPDGRWLVFVSWETGSPNLCCRDLAGGDVRRLTYRRDLHPFSGVITRDGLAVLYSAGDAIRGATVPDGAETEVARFAGARVGQLAVAPDGRAVAAQVSRGGRNQVVMVDLFTGAVRVLVDTASPVGHVQVEPGGAHVLYSGDAAARIWTVPAAGGEPRAWPQGEGEWVTHESWLAAGRVAFVKFHDGLYVADGLAEPRALFKGPIWHAAPRPDGALLACDTHAPDIGLVLVAASTGRWKVLCHPRSSNRGTRWFEPLPAGDSAVDPSIFPPAGAPPDETETLYGPQWTHPHPSWHPDGRSVLYTSDQSGTPQVYRAMIPPAWPEDLLAA